MKYFKLLIVTIFCFGLLRSANAQIVVIVNKGNLSVDVTPSELKEIYLGEKKKWGNGTKIILVDQKSNKKLANNFYTVITGKSLSTVKESWVMKMLTGEMSPPKAFHTDEEIVNFVSMNSGAIGFVDESKATSAVKVLLIDGKSPDNADYRLKK